MERIRRTLAVLALAALAAGSFQPFYLRIWRQDLRALNAFLTELPYRKVPGMRALLVEVDRRTPLGARILFVTPHRSWEGGYDYAFRRAQYLLAGRELVPMLDEGAGRRAQGAGETPPPDVLLPPAPRALRPDYIVCWSACAMPAEFAVVWRDEHGTLARRIR